MCDDWFPDGFPLLSDRILGHIWCYITYTTYIHASYTHRSDLSKRCHSTDWHRQVGLLPREKGRNVSSSILPNIMGIPYFLVATLAVVGIGNGMAGIGTQSPSEFIKYWTVLFLFTLCLTYFGMMITFLAPVPTLAAFAVSIVTSLWVLASGVVVMLSDIKFYRWMYWSNPFQYAMNVMTSISFYCNTEGCGSQCNCP